MTSSWFMYVLECMDLSLYCGVTTDPARRLREHNGQLAGVARYTRPRRPVRLMHTEPHPDRSEACKAEAAFKRLSRKRKLVYIKKWKSLATDSSGC